MLADAVVAVAAVGGVGQNELGVGAAHVVVGGAGVSTATAGQVLSQVVVH